jgi:hypothetical protein
MSGLVETVRTSSSDSLRADVSHFLERADEIVAHPLAHTEIQLSFSRELDPATKELVRLGFGLNNLPKESWAYLATLMRPIVFNKNDSLSFARLTSNIGREHAPLASSLKAGRTTFAEWERHHFMGLDVLPAGQVSGPQRDTPTVTRMWMGPVDTFPPDLDLSETVWDYEFADVFFNGCLWHSDREKAARYEAASPVLRQHILKCAEIRTLSAVKFVGSLRQFVIDARADGYDF